MIRFWRRRSKGPEAGREYVVSVETAPGTVSSRTCKLWRPDSRYAGHVAVYRDPESEGAVLEFDALRHGGKEPRLREVVAPEHVDKLILSLLEIRGGPWEEGEPC